MQTPIDGTAIRQIRLERHWSQKALAKHLGITRPYLAQIENGVRSPSSLLAAKVHAWLNASQDE